MAIPLNKPKAQTMSTGNFRSWKGGERSVQHALKAWPSLCPVGQDL